MDHVAFNRTYNLYSQAIQQRCLSEEYKLATPISPQPRNEIGHRLQSSTRLENFLQNSYGMSLKTAMKTRIARNMLVIYKFGGSKTTKICLRISPRSFDENKHHFHSNMLLKHFFQTSYYVINNPIIHWLMLNIPKLGIAKCYSWIYSQQVGKNEPILSPQDSHWKWISNELLCIFWKPH